MKFEWNGVSMMQIAEDLGLTEEEEMWTGSGIALQDPKKELYSDIVSFYS